MLKSNWWVAQAPKLAVLLPFFALSVFAAKPDQGASRPICGQLLTSPNEIPSSGLKNRLVDYKTGKSSFGEVQLWSLGHVLSLLGDGISLVEGAHAGDYCTLIGFILGTELKVLSVNEKGQKSYDIREIKAIADRIGDAAHLIIQQYPELKDVKPPKFNSIEKLRSWLSIQKEKYGENLLVVSIAPRANQQTH